ncbi:MAG: PKD domain-containing protein [Bacteroidota bacterium]
MPTRTFTFTGNFDRVVLDFGDGSPVLDPAPASVAHEYAQGGLYVATATAYKTGFLPKVLVEAVDLLAGSGGGGVPSVVASFTRQTSGLTVTVTDTSTGASAWVWDWGDGSQSTGQVPGPHTYASAGTYTVRLTINGGADSITKGVTVSTGHAGNTTTVDFTGYTGAIICPEAGWEAQLFQNNVGGSGPGIINFNIDTAVDQVARTVVARIPWGWWEPTRGSVRLDWLQALVDKCTRPTDRILLRIYVDQVATPAPAWLFSAPYNANSFLSGDQSFRVPDHGDATVLAEYLRSVRLALDWFAATPARARLLSRVEIGAGFSGEWTYAGNSVVGGLPSMEDHWDGGAPGALQEVDHEDWADQYLAMLASYPALSHVVPSARSMQNNIDMQYLAQAGYQLGADCVVFTFWMDSQYPRGLDVCWPWAGRAFDSYEACSGMNAWANSSSTRQTSGDPVGSILPDLEKIVGLRDWSEVGGSNAGPFRAGGRRFDPSTWSLNATAEPVGVWLMTRIGYGYYPKQITYSAPSGGPVTVDLSFQNNRSAPAGRDLTVRLRHGSNVSAGATLGELASWDGANVASSGGVASRTLTLQVQPDGTADLEVRLESYDGTPCELALDPSLKTTDGYYRLVQNLTPGQ